MAKEKRFVKLMEESQGLTTAVSIYVDSENRRSLFDGAKRLWGRFDAAVGRTWRPDH